MNNTKSNQPAEQATFHMTQMINMAWSLAEQQSGMAIPEHLRIRLTEIMTAYGSEMLDIGYRAGIRRLN